MYEKKPDDSHLLPFCLTPAQKAKVALTDRPVSLGELTYRFNEQVDGRRMKLLGMARLGEALVSGGYFAYIEADDGHIAQTPTPLADKLGVIPDVKRLAGGGEATVWLFGRRFQQEILLHLNALIGEDKRLDDEFIASARSQAHAAQNRAAREDLPRTAAPAVPEQTRESKAPSHFQYCWNCEGKIPARYVFTCPTCGWPICPKCGACKSPRMGGCRESAKGLGRFSGLMREKNDVRARLCNHGQMDGEVFADLRRVESPADLLAFREKYADRFERLDALREEQKERRSEEAAARIKEAKLNQKGFFRLVSVSPRLVTYVNASGMKKSIPNQPPVRVGKEYVDLSGIDPAQR